MSSLTLLFVILGGLVGSAFFSGMETGLLSLNRIRLRHLVRRRVAAAAVVDRLLQRPDLLLGTILIGNNLCNVVLSVYSTQLATRWIGSGGGIVASVIMTLVVLVGGEYLPKAWFQSFPAKRILPLVWLLDFFARLLYPLSWLLQRISSAVFPDPAEEGKDSGVFVTREELIHLAWEGLGTGMLTRNESRMIHGVFKMGEKTCGDLMIPLDRVVCVSGGLDTLQIREVARKHGFSRYPVYTDTPQKIVGILHLRDVLSLPEGVDKMARTLMRKPLFVTARTAVDRVLPRMRAAGASMMLVTGNQREVIGVITIEEVLAEIVGPA